MRRLLTMLFAVIAIGACDSDTTGSDDGVEGSYQLQTVAGQNLPFTLFEEASLGIRIEWVATQLLIEGGGSFREIDTFRETEGTSVTTQIDTIRGTWTMSSNNAISLTATDEDGTSTLSGTWNGSNQLTFTDQGIAFVFRR